MRGSADRAVVVVLALAILLGGLYGLSSLRGELTSECGGFSCQPGSVVLPGKDLHYFFDHAAAACAWSFDDLTAAAMNSAREYAESTYPIGTYAEMEQKTAYLGCLEGFRSPLHAPAFQDAPGNALHGVYDSAARVCARRGVGRIAREFQVPPTRANAAKAYANYKYPVASYGEEAHETADEACLEAFTGPPQPAPPKTDVRVTVPHLQGVRIARAVVGGVHHYFVVADSPRRLLREGWMTPLFDSFDFRGRGAHPVRVHLYTSKEQLVLSAGKSHEGGAWMHVFRERFVPCGPVWYLLDNPSTLGGPSLAACAEKPRLIGR